MKECKYKKCKSKGWRCSTCKHNPNNDDDYYEPRDDWYKPKPMPWFPDPIKGPWIVTCRI